jgi:hypothetical protein
MQQPSFLLEKPSKTIRVMRLLWVSSTAAIFAAVVFASYGQSFNPHGEFLGLWAAFMLIAAVPILGAILEICGSKFAKRINVGFWIALALYYIVGAIFEWSDPFGPLVLLIGGTLLIPAGINYLLYRKGCLGVNRRLLTVDYWHSFLTPPTSTQKTAPRSQQ